MKSGAHFSTPGPSRPSGLGPAGDLGGSGDRPWALSCGDLERSPRLPTGWSQALKQQRTSPPPRPHLRNLMAAASLRRHPTDHPVSWPNPARPRRSPAKARRMHAFERRVWRGEKNGRHSNTAEGRYGLQGPEKGLRGRRLANP